jgi:membrane-associated protease RseP (regulator of RpoE activity)
MYWFRYFFSGLPIPFGGQDVLLHPIAWAGWSGLLITALNLIPAGQLDGGHVIFVLFGEKAKRLWPLIVLILLGLGFIWTGWFIWAGLIFFLGRTYAQPLDDLTPLDDRRKLLAILGLVIFVLVFMPVPLRTFFN